MRSIPLLLLLLLAPLCLAVEVSQKQSGIVRGSWEYSFPYDPNNLEPVVVDEVRANDLISVVHGKTKSGLPIKHSFFFKTVIGKAWRYDIMKGERNLVIELGTRTPIDLDGDAIPELEMEFTELSPQREGTFTFYRPGITDIVTEPEESVEEQEELPVVEDEGQDDLGLTPTEEEPEVPSQPVVEPAPEVAVGEQKNDATVLVVIALVLGLALVGAIAYTFLMPKGFQAEPKQRTQQKGRRK